MAENPNNELDPLAKASLQPVIVLSSVGVAILGYINTAAPNLLQVPEIRFIVITTAVLPWIAAISVYLRLLQDHKQKQLYQILVLLSPGFLIISMIFAVYGSVSGG